MLSVHPLIASLSRPETFRFLLAVSAGFVALQPTTAVATTPTLLQPSVPDDESYREAWTAIALLEDGTYLLVQLAISNMGAGDGHGGCRALVIRPSAQPWTASAVADAGTFKHQGTPVEQLTVGPCRLLAGETLRFELPLDGGSVALTLLRQPQAHAPPDSHIPLDPNEPAGPGFRLKVLVPWARAEVRLTRDNQPTANLKGFGYADHLRSTVVPKKVASQWIRFRAFNDTQSLLLLARKPADAGPVRGWVWKQPDSAPEPLTGLELTGDQEKGFNVVALTNGGRYRVTTGARLYRYAPVEQYGMLGRLAGPLVGNPVTTTFRARLVEGLETVPRDGIFEISRADD